MPLAPLSPVVAAGAVACGYLAGSIPTGLLMARARGIDLRKIGSGNIGATNVARALGKKLGALVLLVDVIKGFLPVLAARRLWLAEAHGAELVAAVGLAAVLGHVFPVWLRLRGGKGVATALGVFLALAPVAAGVAVAVYAALYAAFRISSIGSLAGATAMPVAMLLLESPRPFVAVAAAGWLIIVIRHRGNLRRLWRREETKV